MSVNITVNGKYTKSCLKHNLLTDPERVKKEKENERRKLRIQQVRAVSKNMAKKVRDDVEMEKERQLKKIEELKAQEMEIWRQNVLAQQNVDFRSAIFQVGTAHRAAQAENKKQAQKIENRPKPLKRNTNSQVGKENVLKNANVQTDITCKSYPICNKHVKATNTERIICVEGSPSEFEEEDTTCLSTDLSSDSDDSQSSSSSSSKFVECSNTKYTTVKASKEGKTKINTKGTCVKELQSETDSFPISVQHHKQSKSSGMSERSTPKNQKCKTIDKGKESKSKTEEHLAIPATSAATRKRFTQISDIIRQQKSIDEAKKQVSTEESDEPRVQKSPTKSIIYETSDLRKTPTKSTLKSPTGRSGSSTQSQRSAAVHVQFYDYNNKFEKQYEQSASTVEVHDTRRGEITMNAMEQAELVDKLREQREAEMAKLRQKSDERCRKAIEREQVRRACEDLTAKLDALTKQRPALPPDNHQFSSLRLGQVAAEKETKLNNAVEDILRRPAVITCPVVNRQQSEPAASINVPRSYDLNLGSAFTRNEINSLNSSDSCCSILLGYVNGQSKQIADDIKKCNNQNGETNKAKAEKLENLLNRINRLRESLMDELDKCSTASADKERVQTMMDSISELRKEHEHILIDSNSKASISKRENDLKKKEAILEKKLRAFYKIQKAAKKNDKPHIIGSEYPSSTEENNGKIESAEEGYEKAKMPISVGNRDEKSQDRRSRSKKPQQMRTAQAEDASSRPKVSRNRGSLETVNEQRPLGRDMIREDEGEQVLLGSEEESDEEIIERQEFDIGEQPMEIVIKVRGETKTKKVKQNSSKSPRKLSTLIQSPVMKNNRKKLPGTRSNESSSTSYRSLPSKIHTDMDKLLNSVPKYVKVQPTIDSQPQRKEQEEKSKHRKKASNLNPLMAHYVQRLLGMSRTSIDALGVNSSDVDTPSSSILNTTANVSAAEIEKSASNRLQHVQKFIEDNYSFIGELEDSIRQSTSTDSSLKTVEVIWKRALKEHKSKKNNAEQGSQTEIKMPTKSSLKKSSPHRSQKKPQTVLVDKSTQLTDNCTQRIAELTEKINKVRQEKQKILETTLSSVSENGRNSTEYLDLPDRRNNSGESTSRILDSQIAKSAENLRTQTAETLQQLEKNKSIGMSRDSGISESRPITAQESRDSLTDDLRQGQLSSEYLSFQFKKPKPPISIVRYSPQLVEDVPHELSTIFEVETPGTSRINTTIRVNLGQETTKPQLENDGVEKISYRKFPTYEEYLRLNHLDMSQFDPEFSQQFEKEFNEFISLAREGKINDYEEFTSFSKYFPQSSSGDDREAAEAVLASLKLANLSFKKFPTRKEYLEKIGVSTSDFLDSRSLDNTEEHKNVNSNSSSTESLMNIETELKLRNILTKSFRQNAVPDNRSSSYSTHDSEGPGSTSKFLEKNGELSGILQLSSTDDQSENIENDLKRMGINWPSAMKKKTIETQALSSSTSSSQGPPLLNVRRKPPKLSKTTEKSVEKETHEATGQTEDGGRPLNFREFVTKELLKRTNTSSSFTFSDDSVASTILRSIIGSIAQTPQQQTNGAAPGLDRHKTSTPMASHSSTSKSQGGVSSEQLFSGESRLSSVHFNNSSKDVK